MDASGSRLGASAAPRLVRASPAPDAHLEKIGLTRRSILLAGLAGLILPERKIWQVGIALPKSGIAVVDAQAMWSVADMNAIFKEVYAQHLRDGVYSLQNSELLSMIPFKEATMPGGPLHVPVVLERRPGIVYGSSTWDEEDDEA